MNSDIFDEINRIEKQILTQDLGDTFEAKVTSVKRDEGDKGPRIKLELLTKDGSLAVTTFKIPRKWTGKGQLDMLKLQVEKLGLKLSDIEGKTFLWQRIELSGSVKGFARHYPIKLVSKK